MHEINGSCTRPIGWLRSSRLAVLQGLCRKIGCERRQGRIGRDALTLCHRCVEAVFALYALDILSQARRGAVQRWGLGEEHSGLPQYGLTERALQRRSPPADHDRRHVVDVTSQYSIAIVSTQQSIASSALHRGASTPTRVAVRLVPHANARPWPSGMKRCNKQETKLRD